MKAFCESIINMEKRFIHYKTESFLSFGVNRNLISNYSLSIFLWHIQIVY